MLEKSLKDKYNKRKINAKLLRLKHLIIKNKRKKANRKTFSFPIAIWNNSDYLRRVKNRRKINNLKYKYIQNF